MFAWFSRICEARLFPAQAGANQSVLVVENELFGGLVKHLLSQEPDLRVISMKARDATALAEAIRQTRPDVVVVRRGADPINPPVDMPPVRFITLSADDEQVGVREGVQKVRYVHVTRKQDLVALVRGR